MRPRRAVRRLLDPWAGLLFAALIVLGVVILLSTPGPWRVVGETEAPVTFASKPPNDLAVFVLAGPGAARCTAVVWLHVEHESPALTATLVPAQTRCAVPEGGYAPLRRLVTDVGAAAASDALGWVLGVEIDGWVTLDRAALLRLFTAARASGDGREGLLGLKVATAAYSAPARDVAALRLQSTVLQRALRALPFEGVKANAVINYALGSADVDTGLDLRAVSRLTATLGALGARDVAVGAAAAIVERCGAARSWRLDMSRLGPLRLSLALGLDAPRMQPNVAMRDRAPVVLLVTLDPLRGRVFARDLEAALRANGALPVAVRSVALAGEGAAVQLAATLAEQRPLAVVLAPDAAGVGSGVDVAESLAAMADVLRLTSQPGVIVGGEGWAGDEMAAVVAASRLPFVESATSPSPSPASGTSEPPGAARRETARLVAEVLVRSCWPDYLAPELAGTRLEFSYAARRATDVAVAGGAAAELASSIAEWGYRVAADDAGAWATPSAPAIAYQATARRAALALAGDLGWPAGALTRDAAAPAALTVVGPPG